MFLTTGSRLQKLSREFEVHCRKDPAKRCILFSKVVLRSLNVWPDNEDKAKYWLMMTVIVSCFVMGLAHLAYVVINVSQITKMTTACTTVLVSFETVAKLMTMIHYRVELNAILTAVWRDFWPTSIIEKDARLAGEIRFRSNYVTTVGVSFLCMAFFSNAQFMMYPIINNLGQLPLASWYPFDFQSSPQYEIMYLWQWFMNQVIITTLSGFDAFFNGLVMICATQFQILQNVLANMNTNKAASQWICDMLENIFAHIVFMQFIVSASAMCVSCVALIADPDVWAHMLSYLVAHVFQFFIYCSVGNELTYQSVQVADAAYDCNWEASTDLDFRRALILVILRAQKPLSLTVAGLMQLSYANFIATVQLSFSFYVLLDSFIQK